MLRHVGVFLGGAEGLGIDPFVVGLQVDLRELELDVGGFDVGAVLAGLKIHRDLGGGGV